MSNIALFMYMDFHCVFVRSLFYNFINLLNFQCENDNQATSKLKYKTISRFQI